MQLQPSLIGPLVGICIAAGVIVWRNSKPRRLKIEMLWVRPAIFAAVAALLMSKSPPVQPLILAVCVLGLIAGLGVGWIRGKMMRIAVDPETHLATVQGSPVAVLFILAVMVARFAIDYSLTGGHMYDGHAAASTASQLTDGLLTFAVGIFIGQGVEMMIRARRMIGDSRAAKAQPIVAG